MESQEDENKRYPLKMPIEIKYMEGLSFQEKGLLAEIKTLDRGPRGCFATNSHFGDFLGLSDNRVSKIITKLRKLGLVSVYVDQKAGNKRSIRIKDLLAETPIGENDYSPKEQDPIGGSDKDLLSEPPTPIGESDNYIIEPTIEGIVEKGSDSNPPQQSGNSAGKNTSPKINKESNPTIGAAAALPFESQEFATLWGEYLQMRRDRRFPCSDKYQVATLNKLAKYEEGFALKLLQYGNDNQYQGLFFDNTETKYQQYLREKDLTGPWTIQLSYDSPQFTLLWGAWKTHLHQLGRGYETAISEQSTLNELQQYNEEFSIALIKGALNAGKWTLIWPDTKEKFQQYLKQQRATVSSGSMSSADYEEMFFGNKKKATTA